MLTTTFYTIILAIVVIIKYQKKVKIALSKVGIIGFWLMLSITLQAQSWKVTTIPGATNRFPYAFSLPDENTAWAFCLVNNFSQFSNLKTYFKSIDGGNTWSQGDIPTQCNFCNFTDFFAQSQDTAWALFALNTGKGEVYKTEDGGTTWKRKALNTFTDAAAFPNIIHFFDAKNGVMMGDPVSGYFEIYTTTDGGENWIRVPSGNIAAELSGEFSYFSLKATVGDTIWFGTSARRIYRSVNRGLNWTVSNTPFQNVDGRLSDITFKNNQEGYAIAEKGGNFIAKTTDGGATWSILVANKGFSPAYGLTYIPGSGSHYMMSGLLTAYSTDDCKTWTILDENYDQYGKPAFYSPNIGYVGAKNARILQWRSGATSTKYFSNELNFNVYPSPVQTFAQVHLRVPTTEKYILQLSDTAGRHLQSAILQGNNNYVHKIDLTDFPAGMYIITVLHANVRTSKWLLKQ